MPIISFTDIAPPTLTPKILVEHDIPIPWMPMCHGIPNGATACHVFAAHFFFLRSVCPGKHRALLDLEKIGNPFLLHFSCMEV